MRVRRGAVAEIERAHRRALKRALIPAVAPSGRWSSGYPHSATAGPDSRKRLDEWLGDLPPDEANKVVRARARALCRLAT